MVKLTVVLKDVGLAEQLKQFDKRDEYGDEKNYWLVWDNNLEEMTFEKNTGEFYFAISSNDRPSVFIHLSLAEFIEQCLRFKVIEDINEYLNSSKKESDKLSLLIKKIENIRKPRMKKRVEKNE